MNNYRKTSGAFAVIKSFGFGLLVILCAFILQVAAILGSEIWGFIITGRPIPDTKNGIAVSSIVYAILSAAIAMIIYYFIEKSRKKALGNEVSDKKVTGIKRIAIIVAIGVIIQLLMGSMLGFLEMAIGDTALFEDYLELIESIDGTESWLILVYSLILGPISEEYIFRGVMYSCIRKYVSARTANVIQAALFGLFHFNVIQGSYAFLGGLVFGYVAEHKKSMLELCIMHMVANSSGVLVIGALEMTLLKFVPAFVMYGITGLLSIGLTVLIIKSKVLESKEQ